MSVDIAVETSRLSVIVVVIPGLSKIHRYSSSSVNYS